MSVYSTIMIVETYGCFYAGRLRWYRTSTPSNNAPKPSTASTSVFGVAPGPSHRRAVSGQTTGRSVRNTLSMSSIRSPLLGCNATPPSSHRRSTRASYAAGSPRTRYGCRAGAAQTGHGLADDRSAEPGGCCKSHARSFSACALVEGSQGSQPSCLLARVAARILCRITW